MITPKILAAGLLGLAACRGVTSPAPSVTFPIPSPAFAADSARVDTLAPGVVYRFFHASRGPWAIHVLDADRGSCWTTIALKAGSGAIGRASTSSLVADAARHTEVIGGVNADFFSFTPPGVPTGAHVHGGRLVTGPVERPAFLIDDIGAPHLATLATRGTAITGDDTIAIGRWNRRDARIVAWFDAAWGARTDTATGAIEVVLDASPAGLVAAIDTLTTGVAIPARGGVLFVGANVSRAIRDRVRNLRPNADSIAIHVALTPLMPREAVGGFPILLRDSVEVPGLDSAGGAGFGPVRHPRTAVGIGSGGRRLILVEIDGRQLPYSAGMTLRELAALMRDLGAAQAMNLDGGGSSTLVRADRSAEGGFRVANHPSDATGERPVANALALARRCER